MRNFLPGSGTSQKLEPHGLDYLVSWLRSWPVLRCSTLLLKAVMPARLANYVSLIRSYTSTRPDRVVDRPPGGHQEEGHRKAVVFLSRVQSSATNFTDDTVFGPFVVNSVQMHGQPSARGEEAAPRQQQGEGTSPSGTGIGSPAAARPGAAGHDRARSLAGGAQGRHFGGSPPRAQSTAVTLALPARWSVTPRPRAPLAEAWVWIRRAPDLTLYIVLWPC
jgi:hypothetical protein